METYLVIDKNISDIEKEFASAFGELSDGEGRAPVNEIQKKLFQRFRYPDVTEIMHEKCIKDIRASNPGRKFGRVAYLIEQDNTISRMNYLEF